MKLLAFAFLAGALTLAPLTATAVPQPVPPPAEPGSDRVNDTDDELARARAALAEAARRVAELSAEQADRFMRHVEVNRVEMPSVRLGIVAGQVGEDGVTVASVAEDGPAAKAGLRAGDVLLEVNGVEMGGAGPEPGEPSARRVQQALLSASEGDQVPVRYRRGRQTREATVAVEATGPRTAFGYRFGNAERLAQFPPMLEGMMLRRPMGEYELVRVTRDLGSYFNADRGLLVVRVGDDNPWDLRDGDVILSIDGREPESPTHAARIFRSYAPGEAVTLEIMRGRRKHTLEVTVPEARRTATMLRDAAPRLPLRAAP